MFRARLWFLCLALCSICFLAGCERTNIADILKNPQRYSGVEITIAGKVTNTAIESGSFQLDDGTGQLWVLTTDYQLPQPGSRLAVTALVEGAVKLGSSELPVTLQEIRRLGERGTSD